MLAATAAVFVLGDVKGATSLAYQRDDWREVARALGPARGNRVIVVAPGWQIIALPLYAPRLKPITASAPVTEVDTVVYGGFVPGTPHVQAAPLDPTFRASGRWTVQQRFTIARFQAVRPVALTTASFSQPGFFTPNQLFSQSAP